MRVKNVFTYNERILYKKDTMCTLIISIRVGERRERKGESKGKDCLYNKSSNRCEKKSEDRDKS